MKIFKGLWKNGWLLCLILGALVPLFSCKERNDQGMARNQSNDKNTAPDFSLQDLKGKTVHLSDFKGKVVILDFWATWCPPCKAEIPHFVNLYKKYESKGLTVLGVSVDEGGVGVVKSFVEENGVPYPIVMGNEAVVKDFGGLRGIPTTFVIDRNGQIARKLVGYHQEEEFESILKLFL